MTKEEAIAIIERRIAEAWDKHAHYLHRPGLEASGASMIYHGIAIGLEEALCCIKQIDTDAR